LPDSLAFSCSCHGYCQIVALIQQFQFTSNSLIQPDPASALEDGIGGGHDEQGDESGEEQAAKEISKLPFSRFMLHLTAHTTNTRSIHSERPILSLIMQLPVEMFQWEK